MRGHIISSSPLKNKALFTKSRIFGHPKRDGIIIFFRILVNHNATVYCIY